MAYVSGSFLHVVICEVKRADTFPWQKIKAPTSKQAVNKAENQATRAVYILMDILAGLPPSQILFRSAACFPDSSSSELESLICSGCLEMVICQEDLSDISRLQKKTMVPQKLDLPTASSSKHFLTLCARLLSNQSLLHIGYREFEDKEKLVTERQRYNLESVDRKLMRKEYAMASPQQREIIASFSDTSNEKHLVLRGPAGTGKTLVAVQVVNNLVDSLKDSNAEATKGPVLIVTTQFRKENDPIMKFLDSRSSCKTKIFKSWTGIQKELRVSTSETNQRMALTQVLWGLAKKWEDQEIVLLMDEILKSDWMLCNLRDDNIPTSVRLIMIVNPDAPKEFNVLPSSFLQVTLTTPYRSTLAITSFAQFIAKCKGLDVP